MKKISLILLFIIALSCDDGNFDIPTFDFSTAEIDNCGDIVLYKINENETLIIELTEDNTDNSFFIEIKDNTYSLSENGSNTIIYRVLENNPSSDYFCQNIPPTTPTVLNEWLGSGTLLVKTILESEDDVDNISSEIEDVDGDGDPTNDDSDLDGIPDYLDTDDDNDGILTKNEDVDGDDDPTNDDTDSDGISNYLDDDDDGDNTLTINESLTEDSDGDTIKDYLDADSSTPLAESRNFLINSYNEYYLTSFNIELLKLTNINGNTIQYDIYDFGSKSNTKVITE